MMKPPLAIIALFSCVSCSMLPTPMPTGKGGSAVAILVGGKGVLNYNADGSMAYSYSNEKSFQHAMQAATSIGLSYIGYLTQVENEITTRFQAGQITLQQKNAALASLEQAKLAAKAGATTQALPLAKDVIVNPIDPP